MTATASPGATLVLDLADVGPGAPGVGAKARGLGALRAAGLPVPPGFVLTHAALVQVAAAAGVTLAAVAPAAPADVEAGAAQAHQLAALAEQLGQAAIPPALASEVAQRAAALGPVMVRSSFALEDGALAAGPGVFTSVAALTPAELWPAIRAVWLSALSPAAVAYARRRAHAVAAAPIELAVIVQQLVAGRRTTIYTCPPGQPGADVLLMAEVGQPARRLDGELSAIEQAAARLARAAARAIAAPAGADVELVWPDGAHRGGATWWMVQARPIVHPAPAPPRQAPPAALLAPLRAGDATWALDLGHNPDPLSPAQRALVAAVDAAAASPARLCTVAGYLYTTVPSPTAADPLATPAPSPTAADELAAVIGPIEVRLASQLDQLRAVAAACATVTALPTVIAAYVEVIRTWSHQLAPAIAAARRVVHAAAVAAVGPAGAAGWIIAATGPRRSALGAALADVVAGRRALDEVRAAFAEVALAWDVAAPTLGEQPERFVAVAAALAAAAAAPSRPAAPAPGVPDAPLVALATLVGELAERDDLWFARAQAAVRRALQQVGQQLGLGVDVFWLGPDELIELAAHPARARARAAAARAATDRARAWSMPRVIRPGAAVVDGTGLGHDERAAATWNGQGGGGRVVGAVVRLDRLDGGALPMMAGQIVVAPAATPALALALVDARALVCATGGLLDHGAAMARELGLPYVVGCAGAWDALTTGELVAVDGEAGTVSRL